MKVDFKKHYRASENVVAKEIEGELVIVPLKAGLGDLDAEMYALNATGLAVWEKLNGTRSLVDVIKSLSADYGLSYEEVKADVVELLESLLEKGLVVEP